MLQPAAKIRAYDQPGDAGGTTAGPYLTRSLRSDFVGQILCTIIPVVSIKNSVFGLVGTLSNIIVFLGVFLWFDLFFLFRGAQRNFRGCIKDRNSYLDGYLWRRIRIHGDGSNFFAGRAACNTSSVTGWEFSKGEKSRFYIDSEVR